jgi:hypothetical protein
VSDVLTWVNVAGGSEKPHWVYVVLRFKEGKIDLDVEPRWARDEDVSKKAGPELVQPPRFP